MLESAGIVVTGFVVVAFFLMAGVWWNLFFWFIIPPVIVYTGLKLGKHDARHLRRVIAHEYDDHPEDGTEGTPWLR